ncbi:hypothetical protein [Caenimonas soli]|nr:hypothetical protein [Caenimonas soli]
MRFALAVIAKIVSAVTLRRRPSTEVAERAFERAVAQFHAQ